jgi:hypothetical protein
LNQKEEQRDMPRNVKAEQEVLKVLQGKKTIYELTVWVRDHAQYLKWFRNYPAKEIDEILTRYMNLSYQLYNKGLDADEEAVKDFRHFSMITTLALEECR